MNNWPLEIDGREYHPVSDSWIEHGHDAGDGHPRLYAVSAAVSGRQVVHVRYAHPRQPYVLEATMRGDDGDDGTIPAALATYHTWPRSITPRGQDPSDCLRDPEKESLRELWGHRVDDIPAEDVHLIADGGQPVTESAAVAYLEAALDQADDQRARQLIREAIQLEAVDVQEGSA